MATDERKGWCFFAASVGVTLCFMPGCGREPLGVGLSEQFETNCSFCHGSAINPAPPLGLDGSSDTSELGVGAHQEHLQASRVAQPVECEQCHLVPEKVDAPGHRPEGESDTQAEVVFGERAGQGDADPSWEREDARCANTYCHGATLTGGKGTAPVWTQVDGSQIECDQCHGAPPPSPHPTAEGMVDCATCHPDTVDANGDIRVNRGFHVNGTVEALAECNSCHGSATNDAPPLALDGESDTSELGVGAHQEHLQASRIARPVECEQCHLVPEEVGDQGHQPEGENDIQAEVIFGEQARQGDVEPSWEREDARCANTYCHGVTLTGGKGTEPVWTRVDGSQIECDQCHGAPPPSPHPIAGGTTDCATCHPDTVDENGDIRVADGLHVNGTVEATTECNSCHGSATNDAPPLALDGASDTSELGVGAHQEHLQASRIARPVECEQCHLVPEEVDDPGHQPEGESDAHAEVVFGEQARQGEVEPSWDRENVRCANTYCHGATLTGGKGTEPVWTRVDESQIECDRCHGAPPPRPHPPAPQPSDCNACHPGTVDENGDIKAADGRHVNGTVEVITECNSCHGSATNEAPPLAVDGSSDTSELGVGAHQAHLQAAAIARPVACDQCHLVPEELDDPGHQPEDAGDTQAEVTFGALASRGGLDPSWDHSTARCSNTYCHGATLEGGTGTQPLWTQVDGSQLDCDRCHGAPPPLPHPSASQLSECNACHLGTVDTSGNIRAADGFHINGTVDETTTCFTCHGTEGVNEAPPLGLDGSSDSSEIAVGAHQSHLQASTIARPLACEQCHLVPAKAFDPGHQPEDAADTQAEVSFGALASQGGLDPSWDHSTARCSNTYCHGARLTGGTGTQPLWTQVDGSQLECDQCHGAPPPLPHPPVSQLSDCNACHPGTVDESGEIRAADGLHVNGIVNETTTCFTCHGTEGVNAAPPLGLDGSSDTSEIAVGAHQSHLQPSIARAVECEQCHLVPVKAFDPGHQPEDAGDTQAEVSFGALASQGGLEPSWDHATAGCADTYCHGATLTGGTGIDPLWTLVDGSQITCDSCHGFPPPLPHYQDLPCELCHFDTVISGQTINLSSGTHVDGEISLP